MVTVLMNKSEMGQGTWTALAMVVAEELESDWKDIRVEARLIKEELFMKKQVRALPMASFA